jgi:succinate dehydrogenase / fumarate reductase membrane anchor subunit
VQRISAALMAVFTLVVLQLLLTKGPIGYTWSGIFAAQWMKALTFAVIVALLWHAWVGMCSIWTTMASRPGCVCCCRRSP